MSMVYIGFLYMSRNDSFSLDLVKSTQLRGPDSKHGLYAKAKHVTEIQKDEEFEKLISERYHVLTVFYASWCGHCRYKFFFSEHLI
jgi:thiol-disulfide isomerase/thioredoxin